MRRCNAGIKRREISATDPLARLGAGLRSLQRAISI
jgi:hypothetical protein